jgi:3',5'-cyclic AMP phosphodiesterase CpdA
LHIAQISDTHLLGSDSDHPAAAQRADSLQRCVADINRAQPDVVIFTGDTTQHGRPEEYSQLRELLAPLDAPLYPVPGNRDDTDALRAAFDDLAFLPANGGFLHYVVDSHAARLVAIDSTLRGERKGVFCAERQAWLDAELSEQPDKPTVLFIHHPPFDVDDHYVGGYRHPEEAKALGNIVGRHEQVEAFICGHVHCLVERWWASTAARVMPSVAVDLRMDIDESGAGDQPAWLMHSLEAGQGISSRVIMVDTTA